MAFTLRLEQDTEDQAKQRAAAEGRSLTGLVEHALKQYLATTATDAQVAELLPGIAVQVAEAGRAHDGLRSA
jgi:predicted transcriptional regulator